MQDIKVKMGVWQFHDGGWELDGKDVSPLGNHLIYTRQHPCVMVWINEIDLAWLIFQDWRRDDEHQM